ncbi:MAG: hypothetical protein NZ455_16590 [Bacteroidia bacterium]|nr:hypothetical protein [Bacteroidia bacterium]MDW8348519.1 hypothetical protein [Bacteroidia bacterium]
MKFVRSSILYALWACSLYIQAQNTILTDENKALLQDLEQQLAFLGREVLKANSDNIKLSSSQQFIKLMAQALRIEGSFEYPFDSLTTVSKLVPEDKKFRLFTWYYSLSNGRHRYFGCVQFLDEKGREKIVPLFDRTQKQVDLEFKKLSNENWIGALYYQLFTVEHKRKKYYIVIGWNGLNDNKSSIRVIDVVRIEGDKVVFGEPIFYTVSKSKIAQSRVIHQYNKMASMTCKYDPNKKAIIYDHLVPMQRADGTRSTAKEDYVPDGSYDALIFKNGRFVKIKDYNQKASKTQSRYDKKPKIKKNKKGKSKRHLEIPINKK